MKRITVTDELAYRIAFVRHCADRPDAPQTLTSAKVDLADAVLAAAEPARLARLEGLRPRPAIVRLSRKQRRA